MKCLLFLLPGMLAAADSPRPLVFDEIHYYVNNRAAAEEFFKKNFGAREMAHPEGERVLDFITFLSLRPGEGCINVSARGPFPGVAVGDPKRWERELVTPSAGLPPMYGVHWLAIRTGSLARTMETLKRNGVAVADPKIRLPGDPGARAATVWGPEFNRIAVVERKGSPGFGIDHVQLLVSDLAANIRFFEDVYAATVVRRDRVTAVMMAGGGVVVLATPEGLGLDRSQVMRRDAGKFRSGVDHISFLFEDTRPATQAAKAKGYKFLLESGPLMYFGRPTAYVFSITFTPDQLQCELLSEKGRIRGRTRVLN